jgi:hypothetical protein
MGYNGFSLLLNPSKKIKKFLKKLKKILDKRVKMCYNNNVLKRGNKKYIKKR